VIVNGQRAFDVGGISNYGGSLSITDCANYYCHYKLEFFGNTNSNISWPGGFPVDTLVINKTGCAKVTIDSSLYVSGETRIEGGQLSLFPNDNYPYKFVCAGNVDIEQGGGLFLHRDAAGVVANMAVGGTIVDHNSVADSTCAGLSNPYGGIITSYTALLPVTLLDFYGRYSDNTVTLTWNTEREINTKYYTIEKSFDQVSFISLASIPASGNAQTNTYQYTDTSSLNGMIYYRLKIVDVDGRFTYSKIIAIAAPVNNAIMIFPNPVNDKLYIRLGGIAGPTEILITDARGSVIKRLQIQAGTYDATVSTTELPAGVYCISFQSANSKCTQQFIKE
jgi:Secretion system C-terminal sorting domain